jgi:hypothetical protein
MSQNSADAIYIGVEAWNHADVFLRASTCLLNVMVLLQMVLSKDMSHSQLLYKWPIECIRSFSKRFRPSSGLGVGDCVFVRDTKIQDTGIMTKATLHIMLLLTTLRSLVSGYQLFGEPSCLLLQTSRYHNPEAPQSEYSSLWSIQFAYKVTTMLTPLTVASFKKEKLTPCSWEIPPLRCRGAVKPYLWV